MGMIKDGSISGVLPSSNGDVFAVHYPGYPSSIDRAIQTLGGIQSILKVRTEPSNNLELRFRPEDPYSHPAFGKLQPCNNFLLKISKKKLKDGLKVNDSNIVTDNVTEEDSPHVQPSVSGKLTEASQQDTQPEPESTSAYAETEEPSCSGAQEQQLSAEIVAHLSGAYYFNGMVDYQHVLPIHAEANRRKKRNWAEVEPQFEKGGLIDVDQEDLMILLPPLFANKDRPEQLVLKQSANGSIKKKISEGVFLERCKMKVQRCQRLDFTTAVVPKKVNWEESIPRNSNEWQWMKALCDLLDERPIWVKNSLVESLLDQGLNIEKKTLRRLFYLATYYFSNGPFLRFYIRNGYDPRKDPESRVYQRTDFRVPPPLRSYCDRNIAAGLSNRWEDICAFQVFPYMCQTSLQLFELKDDYIQEEIRKPPSQGTCSLQTGWFTPQVIDTMRYRVAQRFFSVYPEAGAQSLLKYATKRFEKSKTAHIIVKDSKVEEDDKQANKGLETEEEELIQEAEYGEDEDEMEDDDIVEDMDADDDIDLVDGNTNFPLQSDSYTDHENISKGYLQELFGSFPFNASGGVEVQDTDPVDEEEYQIYEQYSDGNYTDDDEDY